MMARRKKLIEVAIPKEEIDAGWGPAADAHLTL